MREPIPGDQIGLECKGIENPAITSVCKSGKCVASLKCDGKPLEEKPTEIPDAPKPMQPSPTPSTPSRPATTNPFPTNPTPSPTPSIPSGSGSGSGGGGGGSGNVPNGTPDTELPPIGVVQQPTPRPGTTFTDAGNPFTLGPRPSGSGATFGESPGNVFGDPWGGDSNTTFTGSFGGTGWSGNAAAGSNLFSNFVSAIGSLFGGFGGGGGRGAAVVDTTPTPAANLAPTPNSVTQPPVTTRPPIQIADNAAEERLKALDEKLKKLNEARGTDINVPTQSPLDLPLEKNIITGFPIVPLQPADRIGLPTVGSGEPLIGNVPRGTLPPAVVRDAENPSGITIPIPEPAPQSPPTIVTTIIPATTAEAFVRVEEARDALESRSTFDRFLDWVGIGSAEGVAYRRAQQDLKAASMRESLEKMAVDVRAIPDVIQVAEGGPVMTDAQPVDIDAMERALTPQQRTQFEREYDDLVREFDAAQTDAERTEVINKKLDEIRAIDPAIEKALEGTTFEVDIDPEVAAPPQETIPSRMLEGLSKIGERVADAARTALDRIGYVLGVGASLPEGVEIPTPAPIETPSVPTPEPSPVPETPAPTPEPTSTAKPAPTPASPEQTAHPAPSPAPQPAPQAASRSGSFLQGSLSILSALLGTVLNFFNGDDQSSSAPTQPSQPAQPNAAASITANPSYVDDGDTTELSWTSVGTLSCVVVDSALNIITRGGKEGDLVSPALSVSTRFGVICDIEEGKDKFVNETLVRVNDDTSEPERLFAQSGRVSQAASVSGNGTGGADVGGSGGSSASPQPIDVRTCDPEQSMDTFIRCLCEAEPNPNGCSLVPRQ